MDGHSNETTRIVRATYIASTDADVVDANNDIVRILHCGHGLILILGLARTI